MKTFLVTGGAGFIGSHLVENLLAEGHRVIVLDNLSTGRLDNLAQHERERLTFVKGNVLDNDLVSPLIEQADFIYHLAASVGVQQIVEQVGASIEVNVLGTQHILQLAAGRGVPVLVCSSSEVYGKGVSIPFREDDDVRLGATISNRWAYAASKILDEIIALDYYHKQQLPVTIVRLFNVVGPRQSGRWGMVLPRFTEQALLGEKLRVHGSGNQSRCFLHVLDAVRAFRCLECCEAARGQVFNIGNPGNEIAIAALAKYILAFIGRSVTDVEIIPYDTAYSANPSQFQDIERRVPDISKIQKVTGWQPLYDLDTILIDTITYQEQRIPKAVTTTWQDRISGNWEDWGPDMLQDLAAYMEQEDPEGFKQMVERVKTWKEGSVNEPKSFGSL